MPRRRALTLAAPSLLAMLAAAGCALPAGTVVAAPPATQAQATTPTSSTTTSPPPASRVPMALPAPPVPWRVGARPLPLRPDGYGKVEPTPAALVDRRLPTRDLLPPPTTAEFSGTISTVPAAVVARSTWRPACPVRLDELRYLTVSFWGFDGRRHTGELIVNARAAAPIVEVFRQLHDAEFPLEEMRVVTAAELTAPPTGDGNNTQAFVCRKANGKDSWSAHAYGLAVDINPFCNPYSTGDLVLPELASAYLDRARARPGMVRPADAVVRAFARIGWTWGGNWSNPRDLMHFTATGA